MIEFPDVAEITAAEPICPNFTFSLELKKSLKEYLHGRISEIDMALLELAGQTELYTKVELLAHAEAMYREGIDKGYDMGEGIFSK